MFDVTNEHGFIRARTAGPRLVEITDIAVTSERKKGHGRELLAAFLQEIPADTTLVFAITRCGNFVAQRFYEGTGFRIVGVLSRFYRDANHPEDAIMYGLDR